MEWLKQIALLLFRWSFPAPLINIQMRLPHFYRSLTVYSLDPSIDSSLTMEEVLVSVF